MMKVVRVSGLVFLLVSLALPLMGGTKIANSIADRNPRAIQGTVRAIWESLDMTRTIALHNGLAYTHIGNNPPAAPAPKKQPPSYR